MNALLIDIAAILLLLFGLIGLSDGFYYHLWKFKLYKHKETRLEHLTHTIRAVLFVGILYFLYLNDYAGNFLLIGLGLISLDILTLLIDLVLEGDSRKELGGLPHREYMVHIIANTLHFVSLAFILAAKPITAFTMKSTEIIDRNGYELSVIIAKILIGGAALLALLHIILFIPTVYKKIEQLLKLK